VAKFSGCEHTQCKKAHFLWSCAFRNCWGVGSAEQPIAYPTDHQTDERPDSGKAERASSPGDVITHTTAGNLVEFPSG
jgi:hypothetical protein